MELLYTYETLKLEFPMSSIEEADFVILGIPFDGTTSYKPGTRFGPTLIRQATLNLESYILDYDIDIAEVKIADVGDLAIVAGNPLETIKRGIETIEEIKKANPKVVPIILGGEHSMTFAPVKALKPKSYVVFDAHLDLRESYEDNPWNHACVARRISELGIKVAEFGIRSGTKEEVEYAREVDIPWVHARNYTVERFKEIVKDLPEPVYVSVDIDVFDLSMVPSTGTPEAGGLRFWEVVEALEWLMKNKKVIGFDIMEVAGMELGDVTALTAAKLLFYMIGMLSK
ncbi:MAG: agmatinase [Thermococcaceae archaeon]|jgi:agmatinase|uniref:agmatinase n=1 Tax=Thermococcus bergensis TaxID=2689387 RepID=UPI00199AEBCB|nr:agmatinase [Thermococcus bergensis]MBC7333049.1 agmatinase [Actinomycetota bacterium]MCA6213987.1 agmatinase [Thermococcus bergensis]MDK2783675.1 agmatinase [Thermococcaceae archaeon]